ncbi:unnamed protein product [Mortierella alpina]
MAAVGMKTRMDNDQNACRSGVAGGDASKGHGACGPQRHSASLTGSRWNTAQSSPPTPAPTQRLQEKDVSAYHAPLLAASFATAHMHTSSSQTGQACACLRPTCASDCSSSLPTSTSTSISNDNSATPTNKTTEAALSSLEPPSFSPIPESSALPVVHSALPLNQTSRSATDPISGTLLNSVIESIEISPAWRSAAYHQLQRSAMHHEWPPRSGTRSNSNNISANIEANLTNSNGTFVSTGLGRSSPRRASIVRKYELIPSHSNAPQQHPLQHPSGDTGDDRSGVTLTQLPPPSLLNPPGSVRASPLAASLRLQPLALSATPLAHSSTDALVTLLPQDGTSGRTFGQEGAHLETSDSEAHSGVIMAHPGPALASLSGARRGVRSEWSRFSYFMQNLASRTQVSRVYSGRPQFSSVGSSSWTVARVLNTCHLLYLVPVTTVSIARLLTTETICDEQLFSWLTVQAVLFLSQIICACYLLQQTMSSRIAMLDQRSRILLLVCMIWTVIGVGFLGRASNTQESTCGSANDPVYSLAFKIIIFHASLIGFYFLPCSSFMLTQLLPASISAGMNRMATKPMIAKLGSVHMTEGMFGGDPEEATCAICLGDYRPDETIRLLPCQHHFHLECVDQWLLTDKSCPLCKHDIDKPLESDRIMHASKRFQTVITTRRDSEGNMNGSNNAGVVITTTQVNGIQIIVL